MATKEQRYKAISNAVKIVKSDNLFCKRAIKIDIKSNVSWKLDE
jgi:hypothetical protein